jgi:hypothetical protein
MALRALMMTVVLAGGGCKGLKETPPDLSAESCVVEFSGSVVGGLSCVGPTTPIFGNWDAARNLGGFGLIIPATAQNGLAQVSIEINRTGRPLPGPWSDADAGVIAGAGLQLFADNRTWVMSVVPPTAKSGSFSAELTTVEPAGTVSDEDAGIADERYRVHGSLQATLLPQSGTSGNVELRWRF